MSYIITGCIYRYKRNHHTICRLEENRPQEMDIIPRSSTNLNITLCENCLVDITHDVNTTHICNNIDQQIVNSSSSELNITNYPYYGLCNIYFSNILII